jgi:hypothetical protein
MTSEYKKTYHVIEGLTDTGKGLIYSQQGVSNIGPIRETAVGNRIRVGIVDGYVVNFDMLTYRPDWFHSNKYPMDVDDLDDGEIATITIGSMNSNGYGVSSFSNDELILGPIEKQAVGSTVFVYSTGESYCLCLEPPLVNNNYSNYIDKFNSPKYTPIPEPIRRYCRGDIGFRSPPISRSEQNSEYFSTASGKVSVVNEPPTHISQQDFELGMGVQDRGVDDSDDAVVVNLPPIPANEYVLHTTMEKEVTVAAKNPSYEPNSHVVIIVYQDTLNEYEPDYDGEFALQLRDLSEDNVSFFAYPPGRLEPVSGNFDPDITEKENYQKGKRDASEVLREDSKYKYKTNSGNVDKTARNAISTNPGPETVPEKTTDPESEIEDTTSPTEASSVKRPEPVKDEVGEGTIADSIQDEEAGNPESIDTERGNPASPDIKHLREKAEESAVQEVEHSKTIQQTKSEYDRSTEIKAYVKARADGECEGCGSPAPFTSKSGEPYLHAHHIHELSNRGSDTPDTVVALCPNCHYRVHHGEDGDEYNAELYREVQEKDSR